MSKEHINKPFNLIEVLEPYFAKAPDMPKNGKEALVKYLPYIALIFGILGVLGAVSSIGALSVTSPLAVLGGAEGISSYGTGFLATIVWAISAVMMIMAYNDLKAKKFNGWNMLFRSEVVSIIGNIIVLNIVGAIISGLIGFYLLYQVKQYYK